MANWIDELRDECLKAIESDESKMHPDRVITILAGAVSRLTLEARKIEEIREWLRKIDDSDRVVLPSHFSPPPIIPPPQDSVWYLQGLRKILDAPTAEQEKPIGCEK